MIFTMIYDYIRVNPTLFWIQKMSNHRMKGVFNPPNIVFVLLKYFC